MAGRKGREEKEERGKGGRRKRDGTKRREREGAGCQGEFGLVEIWVMLTSRAKFLFLVTFLNLALIYGNIPFKGNEYNSNTNNSNTNNSNTNNSPSNIGPAALTLPGPYLQ